MCRLWAVSRLGRFTSSLSRMLSSAALMAPTSPCSRSNLEHASARTRLSRGLRNQALDEVPGPRRYLSASPSQIKTDGRWTLHSESSSQMLPGPTGFDKPRLIDTMVFLSYTGKTHGLTHLQYNYHYVLNDTAPFPVGCVSKVWAVQRHARDPLGSSLFRTSVGRRTSF